MKRPPLSAPATPPSPAADAAECPRPILPVLLAVLLAWPGASRAAESTPPSVPIERLFEQALLEEEARRNLEAAMAGYEQVVRAVDDQRRLAATARFRLGECHRKLGHTNDAIAQFQRVLQDFPGEEVLTRLSRENLLALGAPDVPARTITGIWTDPQFAQGTAPVPTGAGSPPPAYSFDWFIGGGPEPAPGVRAEQRKLLEAEIRLLEEERGEYERRLQVGRAEQGDLRRIEREILQLRRQLVALSDATPGAEAGPAGASRELAALTQRLADFANRSPSDPAALADLQAAFPDADLARIEQRLQETEGRLTSLRSNPDENESEIRNTEAEVGSLRDQLQRRWHAVLDEQRDRLAALGSARLAPEGPTAAEAAEIARLRTLIANSPDLLNAPTGDPAMTPLHRAAANGQLDVARFLIDLGAEVNSHRSPRAWTPLHHAAAKGHRAMATLLLSRGALPDAPASDQSTALHQAVFRNYPAVVQALLEGGAGVNVAGWRENRRTFRPSRRSTTGITAHPGESEFSPLHLAARENLTNLVALLIAAKANLNATNSAGMTPLHEAVWFRHDAVVQQLILAGADLNATNRVGHTALHLACGGTVHETPDAPLAIQLLRQGANPNGLDASGESPLLLATGFQLLDVVEALIAAGVDVNESLPLETAHWDLVPLTYALHSAAAPRSHNLDLARRLLEAGARPNVRVGELGRTPLHLAVESRHKAMVELLVAKGADPGLRDHRGQTPADLLNPAGTPNPNPVRILTRPGTRQANEPDSVEEVLQVLKATR